MTQKTYLDKLMENKEFKEKFEEEYKMLEKNECICCVNTDKNIWRNVKDDYYSPSIHVTEEGNIGINVGGHVIVKPVEDWFLLGIEEAKEKIDKEYKKLDKPLKKKQLPKSNKNWEIIPGEKLTDEFINNLVSDFYKNKNKKRGKPKRKRNNADQP